MQVEVAANVRLNTAIQKETMFSERISAEKVTSADLMVQKAGKQVLVINKEAEAESEKIKTATADVQRAAKQVTVTGYEVSGMGKTVQLADVAARKSVKQVELASKDISYETAKLEGMDVKVEQAEQQTLIMAEDVKVEGEKITLAEIAVDKTEKHITLNKEEVATGREVVKQAGKRIQLAEQKSSDDLTRAQVSKDSLQALVNQQTAAHVSISNREVEVRDDYGNKKFDLEIRELDQKVDSQITIGNEEVFSIGYIAGQEAYKDRAIADIQAARILTARLTHLIG